MHITAVVRSSNGQLQTLVQTNGSAKTVVLPAKPTGQGSGVNGGELLLLALATCFCNDLYREATKRNITVSGVEVEFTGQFGGEGEPGFNFQYKANVTADAPASEIEALIRQTDQVAEIHNTLRKGLSIELAHC